MTKTHKIYIPFNWKRTKKLTFILVLANATLLLLMLNSRNIRLDNVHIQSQLKGHFAKHQLQSKLRSTAWLPKLSFLVLQLGTNENRKPTGIKWKTESSELSGFALNKYWMYHDAKSRQILIPYLILPGKNFEIALSYEEIVHSKLQLPQLFLEEGQQEHLQNYKIKVDDRYKKVQITPEISEPQHNRTKKPLSHLEITVITGQPSPKISWEYKQTLQTLEFMG